MPECAACKHQTTKSDKICPNCKADLKSQRLKGTFILVSIGIIFLVTVLMCTDNNDDVQETKKLTAEESRIKDIEKCFSPWDGSCYPLEKAIKESLNDEDSYKHIETKYLDKDSLIMVRTVFSARNAFGGTLKKSVTAHLNNNCQIVKINEWFE